MHAGKSTCSKDHLMCFIVKSITCKVAIIAQKKKTIVGTGEIAYAKHQAHNRHSITLPFMFSLSLRISNIGILRQG
jgi:hypothetical protein